MSLLSLEAKAQSAVEMNERHVPCDMCLEANESHRQMTCMAEHGIGAIAEHAEMVEACHKHWSLPDEMIEAAHYLMPDAADAKN